MTIVTSFKSQMPGFFRSASFNGPREGNRRISFNMTQVESDADESRKASLGCIWCNLSRKHLIITLIAATMLIVFTAGVSFTLLTFKGGPLSKHNPKDKKFLQGPTKPKFALCLHHCRHKEFALYECFRGMPICKKTFQMQSASDRCIIHCSKDVSIRIPCVFVGVRACKGQV